MKYIIITCAFISLTAAAAITEESRADITDFENTNDGVGNYQYSFKTSNGISREETGYLVNAGAKDEHIEVRGSYSYIDPKGNLVVVDYIADENGYRIVKPIDDGLIMPISLPPSVTATLLGK